MWTGRSRTGGELADAHLARVLAEYVDRLKADRFAKRLCDVGHPSGLLALDVRIHDRLAAALAGGTFLLGKSSRLIAIDIHLSIEMTHVNG